MTSIRDDDSSSTSDELDDRGGGDWEDAEPDQEEIRVVSLLDDQVFADAKSMLEYCKQKHGFDFVSIQKQHSQEHHLCAKSVADIL